MVPERNGIEEVTDLDITEGAPQVDSGTGPTGTLQESDVYELVSNSRRRRVLAVLQEEDREVFVRELAEHVAAGETEESVETLRTQDRRRVETALRQFHLPKMAKMGVIDYDPRRKTATLAVPASTFAPYLDPRRVESTPWVPLLLVVGVLSIALFAVSRLVQDGVGVLVLGAYLLLLGVGCIAFGVHSSTSTSQDIGRLFKG